MIRELRALFNALAFRMDGHRVRLADDGAEAVAAVEEEAFDAILLDMLMPVMDGWEALCRIRHLPHGASMPIALFSAFVTRNEDEINQARAQGATTIFLKPIFPNEMLLMMEDLVKRHRRKLAQQQSQSPAVFGHSCAGCEPIIGRSKRVKRAWHNRAKVLLRRFRRA